MRACVGIGEGEGQTDPGQQGTKFSRVYFQNESLESNSDETFESF